MTLGMPAHFNEDKQLKNATLALVGLGMGEIIGGVINGQL